MSRKVQPDAGLGSDGREVRRHGGRLTPLVEGELPSVGRRPPPGVQAELVPGAGVVVGRLEVSREGRFLGRLPGLLGPSDAGPEVGVRRGRTVPRVGHTRAGSRPGSSESPSSAPTLALKGTR